MFHAPSPTYPGPAPRREISERREISPLPPRPHPHREARWSLANQIFVPGEGGYGTGEADFG